MDEKEERIQKTLGMKKKEFKISVNAWAKLPFREVFYIKGLGANDAVEQIKKLTKEDILRNIKESAGVPGHIIIDAHNISLLNLESIIEIDLNTIKIEEVYELVGATFKPLKKV